MRNAHTPGTPPAAILWPVPGPNTSCGYLQGMPLGTGSPTGYRGIIVTSPKRAGKTLIAGYAVRLYEKHATLNSESSRGPGKDGSWYGHDYGNRIVVR